MERRPARAATSPLEGFERAVQRAQPGRTAAGRSPRPAPARQPAGRPASGSRPGAARRPTREAREPAPRGAPARPAPRPLSPLPPPARDPRAAARRRRQAEIRRNRLLAGGLALLGLIAALFVFGGGGGALPSPKGTAAAHAAAVPAPRLRASVAALRRVPGTPPHFVWPARGQGAVGVAGVGLVAHSPAERSVPIASLTKMMTAYLTLRDHPLAPGAAGPTLVMGRADVADWVHASQNDFSNVQVRLGERLSEYQLLEALLLPSADNIADRLAIWDAGSIPAFVRKMNATAGALGLGATHYADASGVNPGSRSDAADQALLAARLMANPVVRGIVSHPALPFPVAGTITNYNPALGVDGIIGIKSGFTSQALGCLATAAWRVVGGQRALVVTVALGQVDGLYGAARVDEQLLGTATHALVPVTLATPATRVATVQVPWSTRRLAAVAPAAATIAGWPGLALRESVVPVTGAQLVAGSAAHRRGAGAPSVGALVVSGPGGTVRRIGLVAGSALPRMPAGWTPAAS